MKKGKHRKHDKPIYRRWPGKWPFRYIWMLWNPLRIVDKRHRIIADYFMRKKGREISRKEREKRKLAGEGERKWFSCKVTRSLDFSGNAD